MVIDLPLLSDEEFSHFQQLFYRLAGIQLLPTKKMLVAGRLAKRLRHYQLDSYSEYLRLLKKPQHTHELQLMVDLLTTHETYFFREPEHFKYLEQHIIPRWVKEGGQRQIWSAACASGEEAYSLAMVLMEGLGHSAWKILGSDISLTALHKAQQGHYLLQRAHLLPKPYLKKYCLKGVRSQAGSFLIANTVRKQVHFSQINLHAPLPNFGPFDLIFLRNTLIYFDVVTKRHIIQNLIPCLKSEGYLVIGHAESLMGITNQLQVVVPTIYKKCLN